MTRPPGCPKEQAEGKEARQNLPGRDRLGRRLDGCQNAIDHPQHHDRQDDRRHAPIHVIGVSIGKLDETRLRQPRPQEDPKREHIEAPVKDADENGRRQSGLFVRAGKPRADQSIADQPDRGDPQHVEAGESDQRPKIRGARYMRGQAHRQPRPDAIQGSSQQNLGAQGRRDREREGDQESHEATPAAWALVEQGGDPHEIVPQRRIGGESEPGTSHEGGCLVVRQSIGLWSGGSFRFRRFDGGRRNHAFLLQPVHDGIADPLDEGIELLLRHSRRRSRHRRLSMRADRQDKKQ